MMILSLQKNSMGFYVEMILSQTIIKLQHE